VAFYNIYKLVLLFTLCSNILHLFLTLLFTLLYFWSSLFLLPLFLFVWCISYIVSTFLVLLSFTKKLLQ